jgi:hypothetical protein
VDTVHVLVLCRAYASPEVLDLPKLLIMFMHCTGTGTVLCRAFASPDVRDLSKPLDTVHVLYRIVQSLR